MMIEEHARLEITLPDGRFFTIPEEQLVNDSLSVSSRCVNGTAFAFGCVSPAQLSARFRIAENVSRYDMYGAEIVLYSWFGKSPPQNGGKRGHFTVTGASKQNGIFSVSASDNVIWLDSSAFNTSQQNGGQMGNLVYERFKSNEEVLTLWHAIDAMGMVVQLVKGLEFTIGSLEKNFIPNGTSVFSGFGVPNPEEEFPARNVLILDGEQSDNLRDYASWLAAYMGGFVIANEEGQIQFRLFQTMDYMGEPLVLPYTDFRYDSLEIAGFCINLNKNRIVTEDNFTWWHEYYQAPYKPEAQVIFAEITEQQNPIIEFIYAYRGAGALDNIVGPLLAYQRWIPIQPFSGIYHGAQYLELGRFIRIMDENGKPCDTVITSIDWQFRGGQKIGCAGEDTRTLSEARKRSQAVRTGERLKTQLTRLARRVEELEKRG